jgi:hypothetical protein
MPCWRLKSSQWFRSGSTVVQNGSMSSGRLKSSKVQAPHYSIVPLFHLSVIPGFYLFHIEPNRCGFVVMPT